MNREQLAQEIYDTAHLTGSFTLRSGQVSGEYFEARATNSRRSSCL